MVITPEQFSLSLALPEKVLEKLWYEPFHETMVAAKIDNPLRIAHFLAQVRLESRSLTLLRELYNNPPGRDKYFEGKYGVGKHKDAVRMGNTQPGDGARYYGRGPIQCTWKNNYLRFGQYIGVDFVSDPDLMLQPGYGASFCGWFWSVENNINTVADTDDGVKVRKIVNGGRNGLKETLQYTAAIKKVLKFTDLASTVNPVSVGKGIEKEI